MCFCCGRAVAAMRYINTNEMVEGEGAAGNTNEVVAGGRGGGTLGAMGRADEEERRLDGSHYGGFKR